MDEHERAFLLAEHGALNADVQRRLTERFALVGAVLSASGVLAGISSVPGEVLLAFPWLVYKIAQWLLHNEINIRRKTAYQREVEAECFSEGFGFLRQKDRLIKSSPLYSSQGQNIESITNQLLVSAQVGAVAFGWFHVIQAELSLAALIFSGVLSSVAVLGVPGL
jgi:hypothetical protein